MATSSTDTPQLKCTQRKAIAALLSTRNVQEAAKAAKVGERTLYTWMKEPGFRLALVEAEAISAATRRLVSLQESAIGVLETTINDEEAPMWAKLRAATAVLDYPLKLRELRNVEERLSALEAALQERRA